MTLALVDKYLEEEADHAAISREGCRQLFVSSGVLARNVILPRWLDSGTSSFFEKPKGPVFSRTQSQGGGPGGGGGGVVMTVGLAAGYGSANYVLHRQFRDLLQRRELHPNPEQALRNVLSDRYFEAVKDGLDADPAPRGQQNQQGGTPMGPGGGFGPPRGGPIGPGQPGGQPPPGPQPPGRTPPGGPGEGAGIGATPGGPGGGPPGGSDQPPTDPITTRRKSRDKLQVKADSTAWALVFYLSRTRTQGLHNFYAEMRRMPRDMELDDKAVLMTFCRCFNLTTPDKTAVDEAAFKQFAVSWLDYMKNVPSYGQDIPIDASSLDPASGGQQGGFPGGRPGGFPGGGPGGSDPGGPGGPGGSGGPGGPG